jgi:hypothetical protein
MLKLQKSIEGRYAPAGSLYSPEVIRVALRKSSDYEFLLEPCFDLEPIGGASALIDRPLMSSHEGTAAGNVQCLRRLPLGLMQCSTE